MRFSFLVVAAVVSFLALTSALAPIQAEEVDAIEAAIKAMETGQFDKAVKILTPAAEAGDVHAQSFLGLAYENGARGTKDYEAAFFWYKKAADQGNSLAAAYTADMLHWGKGTPLNETAALAYYRKSADAYSVEGRLGLAGMLEEGRGGPSDLPAAIKLYRDISNASDLAIHRLNGMILRTDESDVEPSYQASLCYAYALSALQIVNLSHTIAATSKGSSYRVRAPAGCDVYWEWEVSEWRKMKKFIEAWADGLESSAIADVGKPAKLPKKTIAVVEGGSESCLGVRSGTIKRTVVQDGSKLLLKDAKDNKALGAIFGNRVVIVTKLLFEGHYNVTETSFVVAYGEWTGNTATLTNTLRTCKITLKAAN